MKYVGLHTQIWKNNIKSASFLILFPVVIFMLVWLFLFFIQDQPHNGFYSTNHVLSDNGIPWISVVVFLVYHCFPVPFRHDTESHRFCSAGTQ